MRLPRALGEAMANERSQRLFWTFLNQGVVSAGAFICQVTLARMLSPHGYGVFTLVFSALLTLQLVNATLLFYPMSVRIPRAGPEQKARLLGASMVLVSGLSLLLALPLALGLLAFGLGEAALPAVAHLLAWQLQEGLRRCLFGSFRHRDAIRGDMMTYLAPAALILAIGLHWGMSIALALSIMAACAAIGACLHAVSLRLAMPSRAALWLVMRGFWRIGGLPSLGNGFLYHTRLMVVPWALAFHAGPAATAGFQAAMNIVNLSNPLILGLGNLIPQVVARAREGGLTRAWRVARTYTLIAAAPIAAYSVVVCLWPTGALWLFYGMGFTELALELPLRLLVVTALIGFYVEAVLGFLHGASLVGRAAEVNLYGTLSVLVLVLPAILTLGIVGGCLALLAANLVRLAAAQLALNWTRSQPGRAIA